MARLSRIRGPASDFEMIGSFVLVPGFTIVRSFGRGSLDISLTANIRNGTAGNAAIRSRILIDGVVVGSDDFQASIAPGLIAVIARRTLQAIVPGVHTIEVHMLGAAAAGDTVELGTMELVVVELPDWDDDVNLVSL